MSKCRRCDKAADEHRRGVQLGCQLGGCSAKGRSLGGGGGGMGTKSDGGGKLLARNCLTRLGLQRRTSVPAALFYAKVLLRDVKIVPVAPMLVQSELLEAESGQVSGDTLLRTSSQFVRLPC